MWAFALLFGIWLFAWSGPQVWLRKFTTTFDLSSRQVHRFTGFILGCRSEHYCFDDIAGLGVVKKEDDEAINSNYCEMLMKLRSGAYSKLGYSNLAHHQSLIVIADEIKELTGV
jgi:hypothetical protein